MLRALLIIMEKKLVVILAEAGPAGLPLRKIVKHVFNQENSLFAPVSISDVHGKVASYLRYHSHKRGDMFLRPSHGRYALNRSNKRVRAILAEVGRKDDTDTANQATTPDPSWPLLDLF